MNFSNSEEIYENKLKKKNTNGTPLTQIRHAQFQVSTNHVTTMH